MARKADLPELKAFLKANLRERRVKLPLAPGGYLRASGLAELCPREEVLSGLLGIEREGTHGAGDLLTFDHGHGLHWALQNHVLPAVGVLYGTWICLECGARAGRVPEGATIRVEDGVPPSPLARFLVTRPAVCRCGSEEFHYRELRFVAPEYGTGGHPDGFIMLPSRDSLGVIEAKSTALPWEVRDAPNFTHVIQLQVYFWFTGLTWGKILYWNKAGTGLDALIEHTIERDDATIDNVKAMLREVWGALEGGPVPKAVCQSPEAPRAKRCPVAVPCFERAAAEPPSNPGDAYEPAIDDNAPEGLF